jgi:hypothetical protein
MILFIDLTRRGFATCISAIFVVGIIGVNDIVGIVRAVGADGSPVIDGNDGRPVIVGKIGTAVKKEYAVFTIVDAVVGCPAVGVTGGDIVIVVAPVTEGAGAGAGAGAGVGAGAGAGGGAGAGDEGRDGIVGMADPMTAEVIPEPTYDPTGFSASVTPGISVIKSILLSSRIY